MCQIVLVGCCMSVFLPLLDFLHNVTPSCPSQFLTMALLSCSWVLYVDRMFLTSRTNAFHSVYLLVASQLNCGCFSAGPPSFGPHWPSDLWLCVSANVWIATLIVSATAFTSPHSLILGLPFFFLFDLIIYSKTLLGVCFFSLPLTRPTFHS